MPLTKIPKPLDTKITSQQKLGEEIMKLREQIAHLKTYQDKDTGGLELRLESLLQQQRRLK